MQVIHGLLESGLLARFQSGFPEENGYFGYVSNCVGLEGVLACAAIFAPDFIKHDDMILLGNNIENNASNISTLFGSSKKEVEKYNNLVCLSEFFLQAEDEACEDKELMITFGKALIYFWQARLEKIFENKEFEFVLENDLFNEHGLCLTFFEKIC